MPAAHRNLAEYRRRVNRVLDHIQRHRGEPLTLEQLAAVASFSPFHFHRIWKAMTGENLKEHLQRIRLESAANALVYRPAADVLEIALENGFGSASSFARAFRMRFGMAATAWRRAHAGSKAGQADRKPGQAKGKGGQAATRSDLHDASCAGDEAGAAKEEIMEIEVKTLPDYRVAYLRSIGAYGPGGDIPGLWQRLARWAQARDLWTADRTTLGISHDNPYVTDPARCRYDAAIVIPPAFRADGDVNVAEVKGGKYAAVAFRGRAHEIGGAYDEVFGRWLPQSGYQPDDRLIFELYRADPYDAKTDTFRCELCVPVRAL
jgi:AraC family transcriptional regulator